MKAFIDETYEQNRIHNTEQYLILHGILKIPLKYLLEIKIGYCTKMAVAVKQNKNNINRREQIKSWKVARLTMYH